MGTLDGRVALVTGATSGLGERFAQVLGQAGATVIVTGRRAAQLSRVADTLEGIAAPGDMTSPQHRAALATLVANQFGHLDILVNNAGICDDGPLENQTLDQLDAVIDTNLLAPLDLCRLVAPSLFASQRASVINVASIYGLVASRNPMAAYNATKAALINLTRHLAAQWGPRGVRVNALAPGYFPTELTGMLTDESLIETIKNQSLLGRVPSIGELDGPLLFLASDASSYITGHTLVVDGGWTST